MFKFYMYFLDFKNMAQKFLQKLSYYHIPAD